MHDLTMHTTPRHKPSQIAKFMGPTWGPPGSCRPQMGPMLAPWTLLSGMVTQNGIKLSTIEPYVRNDLYEICEILFPLAICLCEQCSSTTHLWNHRSITQTIITMTYYGRDGISNHQPYHCLLNRFFRRKSKKTSKLRDTGLCAGNSQMTGEFPAQMTSNAETVFSWWRHHDHWLLRKRVNVFPGLILLIQTSTNPGLE